MKYRVSGMPAQDYWETLLDVDRILDAFGIGAATGAVAELGCGYGTFTIPAARRTGAPVHAFDIEPDMIEATTRRAKAACIDNVNTVRRDVFAGGFGLADASCGVCLLFNILHGERPVDLLRDDLDGVVVVQLVPERTKPAIVPHGEPVSQSISDIAGECRVHTICAVAVVAHKQVFFAAAWANYATAVPGTFKLMPAQGRLDASAADYRAMQDMFCRLSQHGRNWWPACGRSKSGLIRHEANEANREIAVPLKRSELDARSNWAIPSSCVLPRGERSIRRAVVRISSVVGQPAEGAESADSRRIPAQLPPPLRALHAGARRPEQGPVFGHTGTDEGAFRAKRCLRTPPELGKENRLFAVLSGWIGRDRTTHVPSQWGRRLEGRGGPRRQG